MPVTDLDLQTISPDDPVYPAALKSCSAFNTAPTLKAIGNISLLQYPAIALFCSIKCPDDLILKIYSLAQALRDAMVPTISGFHSPIEQGCLKILLRGTQPIIHCPARSLHNIRLSPGQKQAIEGVRGVRSHNSRLLLISPFSASYSRVTAELANKRNELIGAITQTIFIPYAAPNSKTQALAQRLLQAGKSVITLNSPDNPVLQEQGVTEFDIDTLAQSSRRIHTALSAMLRAGSS